VRSLSALHGAARGRRTGRRSGGDDAEAGLLRHVRQRGAALTAASRTTGGVIEDDHYSTTRMPVIQAGTRCGNATK